MKIFTENLRMNTSDAKALLASFDNDGNIITAYKNPLDQLLISRGGADRAGLIGALCRIPVRYNRGKSAVSGYMLYAMSVSPTPEAGDVLDGMIENAKSDSGFLIYVPHSDGEYSAFIRHGFTSCKKSPFPFALNKTALDGFEAEEFTDNFSAFHSIQSKRASDGFTCGGNFLAYSLRKYKKAILDKKGYIIYRENADGMLTVYDFYYPESEKSTEVFEKTMNENLRDKSLVWGLDGEIESVNCLGEYLY